jgi:hypothetical protein
LGIDRVPALHGGRRRPDGGPLPVRIRESGFKTEHTAKLAGKVALRDFLVGLAREEDKLDW